MCREDAHEPHACPDHAEHKRGLAGGSGSVFINGKLTGRASDPISCGGNLTDDSMAVSIGDRASKGRGRAGEKNQALMIRSSSCPASNTPEANRTHTSNWRNWWSVRRLKTTMPNCEEIMVAGKAMAIMISVSLE